MVTDRLQGLLQRFSVSARMFHSGPLCGLHDFGSGDGSGHLHLIRRGPVRAQHAAGNVMRIEQPSLVLYPTGLAHRFMTDPDLGADLACANVSFGSGRSPLAQALPAMVIVPLAQLSSATAVLDLLFGEAFAQRCGRQIIVDRLFEAVLVLVLRHLIDSGRLAVGPLAGLSHPRLVHAMTAMHDAPREPWTLASLAARAGMSRSRFAASFAQTVGLPAASYLASYRIGMAKDLLQQGRPLERIAEDVGYGSSAALSRAFSAQCGASPRTWKQAQQQAGA
jgi:AraC-like DNA-binding protein